MGNIRIAQPSRWRSLTSFDKGAELITDPVARGSAANALTPGGTSGQLQYNNGGVLDGAAGTNFDGTNVSANRFYAYGSGGIISNCAYGNDSLLANTTGDYNTAIGVSALSSNTTGQNNTANGWRALYANITGSGNSVFGMQALYSASTASYCSAFGANAGKNNTKTSFTGMGYGVGFNNTGDGFVGVGTSAGYNNNGIDFVGCGNYTGFNNIGDSVTAVGNYAGFNNTGATSTCIGAYAGYSNNTGSLTAVGFSAGNSVTAASWGATVVGAYSGYSNDGNDVAAVGNYSAYTNKGHSLTAMGTQSAEYNTGNQVSVIGQYAGQNNTGQGLVAAGYQAALDLGLPSMAGGFVTGLTYQIVTTGTTDFTLIGASNNAVGTVFQATGPGTGTGAATVVVGAPQTAGSFVAGLSYVIISVGTTDFTLIGASSNTAGTLFIATGPAAGTGTAVTSTSPPEYASSGGVLGFTNGVRYVIVTAGTTDFTLIGAADSNPGTVFICTGAGASGPGTGTGSAVSSTPSGNTAIGCNTGRGISYGANNTIVGAGVTGLPAGLTGAVILASGDGAIKYDFNGTTTNVHTFAEGPVKISSYTVATLPSAAAVGAGACAYATDACNVGESTGAGTGSLVASNGTIWRIPGVATAVTA